MNLAAIFGASGVTLGAFGAHLLKKTLEERNTLASWKTAVQYQLIHSVALLTLTLVGSNQPELKITQTLWTTGIVLFSGSLYGLSLGGPRILGPVTPIGGLFLIAGWLSLFRYNPSNKTQ